MNWFAIQTRPKHERTVNIDLTNKGYETFLPLYLRRSRWSDRMKEIEAPLFPGYLFCRMDPNTRLPVLVTPGVLKIVGHGKSPVAVDDKEIAAIQAIVAAKLQPERWASVVEGERVYVQSGPLAGVEGTIMQVRAKSRLIVSVTLLQRSVAVEIDRADVTKLEQPSADNQTASTLPPVHEIGRRQSPETQPFRKGRHSR